MKKTGKGTGKTTTWKGYVRITTGPDRHKYEHRAVMERMAREFCYYPLNPATGLPDGFDVHHVNGRRNHNCSCNLILLQKVIHRHTSWSSWVDPEADAMPDWVNSNEGYDDEHFCM